MDWIELDWIGLDWIGSDRIGSDRIGSEGIRKGVREIVREGKGGREDRSRRYGRWGREVN